MKQRSISRIGSYSRALRINCRKPYILLIALCGIASLLTVLSGLFFGIQNDFTEDFLAESSVFLAGATVMGAVMIPTLFRELYNRQFADVEFSLPMSSSERFLAKLLAVVRYHLLPLAVVMTALIIFSAVIGSCETMIGMSIALLTTAVFFDAVSILSVCCLGRIMESVYVPVVFGTALTLLPYVAFDKLVVACSHHNFDTFKFFDFPFGVLDLLRIFDHDFGSFADLSADFILKHLLCLVIYIAAIALAYQIYRRRDAVQTGTPFVYRSFYLIFSFTVLVTLFMMFLMNGEGYMSILIALAVYAAISISAERGALTARTFIYTGTTFICTYFVTLAVGFAAFTTLGFGFIDTVPGEWIDATFEEQSRSYDPVELQFDVHMVMDRTNNDYRHYFFSMNSPDFKPEAVREVFRTARKYANIDTSFGAYMDKISGYDRDNDQPGYFYADVYRYEENLTYLSHDVYYGLTREDFEKLTEELKKIDGLKFVDETDGEGEFIY